MFCEGGGEVQQGSLRACARLCRPSVLYQVWSTASQTVS